MFNENIKGLKYDQIREILTVFYKNGERKEVPLTNTEYEEFLKTGKFKTPII